MDVGFVLVRPEAIERRDAVVENLRRRGYEILERKLVEPWLDFLPRVYAYGSVVNVEEEAIDLFVDAYKKRGYCNVAEAILAHHVLGSTMERLVTDAGPARGFVSGTLRSAFGALPTGRWDFPGLHKAGNARELASNVRLFFGQSAVEKYL